MAVTIIVSTEKLIYAPGRNGWQASEAYGLSTDVVHNADGTISIPGVKDPYNAMPFMAMDTMDTWQYDSENDTWHPQQEV